MDYTKIFKYIPEVKKPEEKKLDFNTKAKWTLIVLLIFFVLINIPLFGLSQSALEQFEFLATIMGTDFGSIIALGIGPIVMASIILQLLTSAKIININTNTPEGKKMFQGIQKIMIIFFIVFEAIVFVMMGAFQAEVILGGIGPLILIIQLILGGLAIFYMDDLTQKWGFGSGVSLFIAAGVSLSLFTSAFQIMNTQGQICLFNMKDIACSGKVWVLIQAIINRYPIEFLSASATLIATALIFALVVWVQSLKVEVPLTVGRIRGYGVKWPLSFLYTGVIPVIFTAALIAQIQMFGGIIENAAASCLTEEGCSGLASIAQHLTFLGHFYEGRAISGLAFWLNSTNIVDLFIRGGFMAKYLIQGITHVLTFVILSTLFSLLWMNTSGMDSRSQAEKISASGLQLAGFRQDSRILESVLDRYILPLTIMGGIAIGVLSSITNLLGALVSGTSMLLVIMIMFQFYNSITQQHQSDMNPAIKKFMGKQ